MTNRELSQVIRKDLKEHGITSKDVSVRVRDALYDTSVNITIKNPLVRETDVESITRKYSKVDYDQRSMEILAGCNVYVHCEYAYGIFDNVSAPLIPIAEKVFNNEKYNGRKIAENEEVEIHMIKMNEVESRLYEFKKSDKHHSAINGYIIRSPKSLASCRNLTAYLLCCVYGFSNYSYGSNTYFQHLQSFQRKCVWSYCVVSHKLFLVISFITSTVSFRTPLLQKKFPSGFLVPNNLQSSGFR